MINIKNIDKIFNDYELSWKRVISLSIAVSWKDWSESGKNTQLLLKALNKKTSYLKSLSLENQIDLTVITKQAIANAPRDALPLAHIIVHLLLNENLLQGNRDNWDAIFPTPSALEIFILNKLDGHFCPTINVFSELLTHAIKTDNEGNCIRNYITCLKGEAVSSRQLVTSFQFNASFNDLTAKKLFDICLLLNKEVNISADLTCEDIYSMPVFWRVDLLSRQDVSNILISNEFLKKIYNDPHSFKETPEWISDDNLYSEFSNAITKGSISKDIIDKTLDNIFIKDRLKTSFSWDFVKDLKKPIYIDSFKNNDFEKIINLFCAVDYGQFANNFLTLLSPSLPDLASLSHVVQGSLADFINSADAQVRLSSIRLSSGNNQYHLIKIILGNEPTVSVQDLCANALYKSTNEKDLSEKTLSLLIPYMKKTHKNWAFQIADRYSNIGSFILQNNDEYQNHFQITMQSRRISNNVISTSYFKAYNSLGNKGVEIIEVILSNVSKILGSPSISFVLSQVAKYCVSIADEIYAKRGINSTNFITLVNSEAFCQLSNDKQIKLITLKNFKGRSILQQVIKSRSLDKKLIAWMSSQEHLKKTLEIYTPQEAPNKKEKLPDILAYSCVRPSQTAKLLSSYSREQLLNALPEALSILKHKPRIAAALELSVYSDLSALPVMMRLAHKLAPPYGVENYGNRFNDLYLTYELPKKSGGKRIISSPAPHLKSVQRSLLNILYLEGFSDQSMGFVPGRSIVNNAVLHVGKNIVVNSDIKSFFPSTSYKQVYSLSRRICNGSLSPLAARLFSEICCYNGSLATGAPTSPAVSNLIMVKFDKSLNDIAKKLNVTYSRYADDITFSGDSASVWMLKPLRSYLSRLGYELDPKKTNIFRKGRRQTVTGIVVNSKPNIARPMRKRLRAAVHRRISGDQPFLHDKQLSDAALNGYINYLKMISPEKAAVLLKKLRGCPEWKF